MSHNDFEKSEQRGYDPPQFFRAILDSLPTHIAILDETGVIVYVNAAWCCFAETHALNQADYGLGLNYLAICEQASGDDVAQAHLVAQGIREVMSQQRQEYSLEYPCHSPLEQGWFNVRITRLQGDAPDWIVVSHENITERKQAELALLHSVKELELAYQQSVIYARELRGEITARKRAEESLRLSQAQLLLLIEQAPLSIAMFDREMRYLVTSRRWLDDYGRGYADLTGRQHYEVHPDLPEWWKGVHQRGLAGETLHNDEELWVQADGSQHWLRWTVLPWHNAQGEIGGIIITTENITERKRGQEQFRLVVEAAPQAIILVGPDQTIRLVNTQAEALFGYSREELLGQTVELLVPEPVRTHHRHDREGFLSAPTTRPMGAGRDLFGVRKDGSQVPLEIGLSLIETSEGTSVLASIIDITERRRAEESLRESEARFAKVFHANPVGINIFRLSDHRSLEVNEAFLELVGYSYEEVVGHSAAELNLFVDPEARQRWLKLLHETKRVRNLDARIRRKSGEIRHTLASIDVIEIKGELMGLVIVTDITERKRAEEELRENQQRLTLAIHAGNVGLWDWDLRSNKVYFSTEWKSQLGYEVHEVSDDFSEWASRVHPDDITVATARVNAYLAAPFLDYQNEFRMRHKDGSYRWILAQASLQVDKSGQAVRMLGSHIDITERKLAEQKLADYTAQLQTFSQRLVETQEAERRSLARELHDEVGQVMLAVKTNLELIRFAPDPATLSQQLTESVDIVSQALEQIRTLSLDLRPSLLDDFGLVPTLEWYVDRQAKSVPFHLSFQTNVPEMRLPPALETNCFRVVQAALTNIVRHAQATRVEVTLNLVPDSPELALRVRDDGLGFNVAAALKRAQQGQSLGLLGMQERIQLIGGQMVIESRPGHGTEIRVRVPIPTPIKP